MTATVRPSREGDLRLLGALEHAGDAQFRAVGMDLVADAPVPDPSTYEAAHRAGRLLTAVTVEGVPIGFVRVEVLDGEAHVEQVSVHPDHQGRGVGRILLAAAEDWARARGHRRLTLTTFRDVAWNGPYYARLGWLPLPEEDWGPELVAVRAREREVGLDRWPRQAMAKQLGPR